MKTKALRGLGSSLLMNIGLSKAAAKLDPVASGQTKQAVASMAQSAAQATVFPSACPVE